MKNIKGSTLQELLVAMVIIGILFLTVTEGYTLVKRLCIRTSLRMEKNLDSLNAYYKENRYVLSADTVLLNDTVRPSVNYLP